VKPQCWATASFPQSGWAALDAPFAQEEQLHREQRHQHHCCELHHLECNHNGDKVTKPSKLSHFFSGKSSFTFLPRSPAT